jgi:hypothetical protein
MKYPLVILLLVFLSSAVQAEQYRWDYMDIGVSNDGVGKVTKLGVRLSW